MKHLLSKCFFIALFCGTTLALNAQTKVKFDLVIIFKPIVPWADIVDTRTRLGATQLDSTLPSGAKFWRCSIDSGTVLSIPNAFGSRTSGTVNQPSDAVGVICGGGTSDGVSLNGLYIIPEGSIQTEGSSTIPPFFQTCTNPAADSITTVPKGDRALKIAILDSGIDCDTAKNNFINIHTAIAPYLCYGRDTLDKIDNDRNGYVDDFFGYDFVNNTGIPKDSTGHGTFVTGVVTRILAKNSANNVKIFILKVLNAQNRGYEYDIIRAIDYALKMKVEVINCSFISSTSLTDTSDLPLTSAINTALKFGTLVSIAAGNNGKDIDNGANLFGAAVFQNPNIIVTGATSCLDSTASFSNFAKRNVDIMTPGKGIGSTWIRSSSCSSNCYAYYSGTSFAAPQTTAVAAILSSNLTGSDWQKVKCTILKSATNRPFLVNKNRRSATLNGLAAFGRLNLTNTPCDDIINSTGFVLENITTFKASPNPFSATVNVDFTLKETTNVQISVFNSTGQRLVNQSVIGFSGENKYPLTIDEAAGVYIIQIQAGKDVVNQKIVKF
jgi:subtilisin family serine protease